MVLTTSKLTVPLQIIDMMLLGICLPVLSPPPPHLHSMKDHTMIVCFLSQITAALIVASRTQGSK